MPTSRTAIFVHFVWSTWDRLPLIPPDVEDHLHRSIAQAARQQGCDVIAIGGTEDHVHVLLRMPPTAAVAAVVDRLKGASSYNANRRPGCAQSFKWQGSYSAFSVSRWDLARISAYIRTQKRHHTAAGHDLARRDEPSSPPPVPQSPHAPPPPPRPPLRPRPARRS